LLTSLSGLRRLPTAGPSQENLMSAFKMRRRVIVMTLTVAVLAGCASTRLDGTWADPALPAEMVRGPVLVVGVTRDDLVRRVYEDAMAAQLAARGISATRSYTALTGPLTERSDAQLLAAAERAGARHVLSTAVIGQERQQVVRQEPVASVGFGGFGRWYNTWWGLSYPVRTEVRSYPVYVAQTSLIDVGSDRLRWTARTRTTDPRDIEKEKRAFVDVIVEAMTEAKLLPPAPAR
jgi:hypothetical protein